VAALGCALVTSHDTGRQLKGATWVLPYLACNFQRFCRLDKSPSDSF